MRRYILCHYDPADPNSEPQPVSQRWQPRSREHARQIIAAYNRLAADNPEITEVLALFRKSDLRRYRLSLFDPLTGERVRWEGPAFRLDTAGRQQARVAIEEFNRLTADDPTVTLCLGAFPWRGKAVSA